MRVKRYARHLVRHLLRRVGYDLVEYAGARILSRTQTPLAPVFVRHVRLLGHFGIDLVLDVGANSGQYARQLRRHGYAGRIVSFEPLATAFAELQRHARSDPGWEAVNLAIGDRDGAATIHVAANSYSSSLRDMLPAHVQAAPRARYVGIESVLVRRLDSVAAGHWASAQRVFLKCDTQGFEKNVLAGAVETLGRLTGVQLEMSLVPLYAEEALLPELLAFMLSRGFQLMALTPEFHAEQTGQLLQVDGVFFRATAAGGAALAPAGAPAAR